jgi:tRNA-2-methylthio-N6-dimethylallyladenosine synthase
MPTYHIWTIGCQMNQAESERLASLFEQRGYREAVSIDDADLILLNSCVVRQSAENRVTGRLSSLKKLKTERPGLTLAVTGCLVDADIGALQKRFPHVDHFFKAGGQPYWLDDPQAVLPDEPPVSCFVPIMQGCNNACSYCIVPSRRGREVSRPFVEVVDEVRELVQRGAKEVVLLGQNVDAYGHDLSERPDLADLLVGLNGIEGLMRIRFLTSHPRDVSGKLIGAIALLDKVCEQLSLPVQAGDDAVLKKMRRGYSASRYRQLVAELKEKVPGISLLTDVIVGFPGESEEQFENTCGLLEETRFHTVHVAVYSPRPGTHAAKDYEDDVPSAEKKRRLAAIESLQETIAREDNAALVGKKVEVLVEGRKKGRWQGRSRSGTLVFFSGGEHLTGSLVDVKIENAGPWSLQGSLIE